jgi:hypothetical protein
MVPLPISLLATVAASLLNIWLGARIAAFRRDFKVSVGDGGHEPLLRRMRAQANFIENAPFFLILLAGLSWPARTGSRWRPRQSSSSWRGSRTAMGWTADAGALAHLRDDRFDHRSLSLTIWAIVTAVEILTR